MEILLTASYGISEFAHDDTHAFSPTHTYSAPFQCAWKTYLDLSLLCLRHARHHVSHLHPKNIHATKCPSSARPTIVVPFFVRRFVKSVCVRTMLYTHKTQLIGKGYNSLNLTLTSLPLILTITYGFPKTLMSCLHFPQGAST